MKSDFRCYYFAIEWIDVDQHWINSSVDYPRCSLSKEIISTETTCKVLIFSRCLVNLLLSASNKIKEYILTILCHWLWTRYLLQYRIHAQRKVALRAVRCSRHLKSKLKSLFSETVSLVTSALSEKAETQSQSVRSWRPRWWMELGRLIETYRQENVVLISLLL